MFSTPHHCIRELTPVDVPALQTLFEDNPEYFLTVNGRYAGVNEAQSEFDELPPSFLNFSRRWLAGVFDDVHTDQRINAPSDHHGDGRSDEHNSLRGIIALLSDLSASGVWHIGLFLLASHLHGTGMAKELHDELETWMRAHGARWSRLGVVVGNAKAERFWRKCGYVEVRRRENVDTGGRVNTLRVMVKPLFDTTSNSWVDNYLDLVPRDRPGSALP